MAQREPLPDQNETRPEKPALEWITMYRCNGCGSLSTAEGPCLNLSLGAHGVTPPGLRRYDNPVRFVAGADMDALAEWGAQAWAEVDRLRADRPNVRRAGYEAGRRDWQGVGMAES